MHLFKNKTSLSESIHQILSDVLHRRTLILLENSPWPRVRLGKFIAVLGSDDGSPYITIEVDEDEIIEDSDWAHAFDRIQQLAESLIKLQIKQITETDGWKLHRLIRNASNLMHLSDRRHEEIWSVKRK
jgi:hypothetical protein